MCRLLGMVSREHAPLTVHLGDYLKPFVALSAHHPDGWGLAFWDENDDLMVCKAPEAAAASPRFWSAAESARTDAALLHLRRASPGMAVTMDNTHPFVAGSVAFSHNGHFEPVTRVDSVIRELGGRAASGSTDSERYFHLLLAAMRLEDPVSALRGTARWIARLADSVLSLNAVLLTSRALYAFARSDPGARSTAESGTGTFQMFFRQSADAVVVASDGWQADHRSWEPIPDRTVLEVSRADLSVTMHYG